MILLNRFKPTTKILKGYSEILYGACSLKMAEHKWNTFVYQKILKIQKGILVS